MTEPLLADLIRAVAVDAADDVDQLLGALDAQQLRVLVVELAEQLADHVTVSHEFDYSPDQICSAATRLASGVFGVSVEAVRSRDRHRPVTDARAVAQAVARACGLTLSAIGAFFGQHHATVMYAIDKVATTPRLAAAAAQITDGLLAPQQADQAA
ncbi:helix-turn-helix domain-containing protein [Nocardioides limicola]|uniref:helix-turn-helix domain-containing protein n=1 Tax=Nocardioides limicola TaxID=2803368 RepID=UPI00193B8C2F|nr:helix-turn-helix domain-containing protein [Nocardioides sp. DJM-14]